MTPSLSFKYVDLFSGCGGLSLGLEKAGGALDFAVERSPMAAETFYHNLVEPLKTPEDWSGYLEKTLPDQKARGVVVAELSRVLENAHLLHLEDGFSTDVVVGGPPCQGFSLAGRRNPEDSRNKLPWQFLEFVSMSKPKIVVIENVVGMRHAFKKGEPTVYEQLQEALRTTSPYYKVFGVQVNALHYGAPQNRPRLLIVGIRNDIAKPLGLEDDGGFWVSDFQNKLEEPAPLWAPVPTAKETDVLTVAAAIGDLSQGHKNVKSRSRYLEDLKTFESVCQTKKSIQVTNHVMRSHSQSTMDRFVLYQTLSALNVSPRLLVETSKKVESERRNFVAKELTHVSDEAIAGLKTKFNSKTELINAVMGSLTKKHSQRVLEWDKPSRTVVTIGDDYVHPSEARTLTVREFARFQGFPDNFEFRAKETTGGANRKNEVPQYSQVGNAVSPWLGLAIGEMIKRLVRVVD